MAGDWLILAWQRPNFIFRVDDDLLRRALLGGQQLRRIHDAVPCRVDLLFPSRPADGQFLAALRAGLRAKFRRVRPDSCVQRHADLLFRVHDGDIFAKGAGVRRPVEKFFELLRGVRDNRPAVRDLLRGARGILRNALWHAPTQHEVRDVGEGGIRTGVAATVQSSSVNARLSDDFLRYAHASS